MINRINYCTYFIFHSSVGGSSIHAALLCFVCCASIIGSTNTTQVQFLSSAHGSSDEANEVVWACPLVRGWGEVDSEGVCLNRWQLSRLLSKLGPGAAASTSWGLPPFWEPNHSSTLSVPPNTNVEPSGQVLLTRAPLQSPHPHLLTPHHSHILRTISGWHCH